VQAPTCRYNLVVTRDRVVIALCAVLGLLGSIAAQPASAERRVSDDLPRITITAATYNVCKVNCSTKYPWAQRRNAVVRTVAEASPDVLAVQEAPTLPWRATTQWADLTTLLSGVGYQQPSDRDGCSDGCTRGAHIYFNPTRLRPYSILRPSGQPEPPPQCMVYLNNPNLPEDLSGREFRDWRTYRCRDFLGYSPTQDVGVGMASQRELTGMGWGPIQDRNVSWAYLQDIATGGVFLAVSVHLPTEKTTKGEDVRQSVARALPGWIDSLNADRGLTGVPALIMGDLNSYATRQPRGAQWILGQAGFVDAFEAPDRVNPRYGTVNYTPRIRKWDGFPPKPFRYANEASRIDYVLGKNGVLPLRHEVVLHLRGGKFDPDYRGSDHNLVRTQLSLPIVAR
jgi:endonuclease/exonuclease/phosphatase family metal-dependent hydrolase